MSYKSAFVGNVYFVRWLSLESQDHPPILRELEAYFRSGGSNRISAMVCIAPKDLDSPSDEQRKSAAKAMEAAAKYVDCCILIIQAEGFKFTVMRSLATAMQVLSRSTMRPYVENNLSVALERIQGKLTMPTVDVIRAVQAQGIV